MNKIIKKIKDYFKPKYRVLNRTEFQDIELDLSTIHPESDVFSKEELDKLTELMSLKCYTKLLVVTSQNVETNIENTIRNFRDLPETDLQKAVLRLSTEKLVLKDMPDMLNTELNKYKNKQDANNSI